ncbi:MAG: hypothetical protein K9M07_04100 [Simkaniaceae bacterium]|nr:hypothetical protein [Simkaniaceae bacterium]MCF7852410.1 hypothetical protein [Simkaniaceae bacterium]
MKKLSLSSLIIALALTGYCSDLLSRAPDVLPVQRTSAPLCSHLSPAEQEFAMQLSDLHQRVFCGNFTGDQRAEALALLLSKSPKYKGLTPDEAVEMVIQNARTPSSPQ